MIIEVTSIYYDTNGLQRTEAIYKTDKTTIVHMAENAGDVSFQGVNNVVFNIETRRIVMAGGYTYERGLFCDMY